MYSATLSSWEVHPLRSRTYLHVTVVQLHLGQALATNVLTLARAVRKGGDR
jgi:hypothetical protein